MIKENVCRKIDSLGRISLPKSLRDKYGIEAGDALEFYSAGSGFICMRKADYAEPMSDYDITAKVLAELGYNLPEEIKKKRGESKDGDKKARA